MTLAVLIALGHGQARTGRISTATVKQRACRDGGIRSLAAESIPGAPDGAYFGQVDFVVSDDARGEFLFSYVGAPDLETIIVDDNGFPVLTAVFDALVIRVPVPNTPSASAWGMTLAGLVVLTVATLALRGRRLDAEHVSSV